MGSVQLHNRNLSLECCKLAAACFVVFLHVPFPAPYGGLVSCLARFGVPLFFAVSGWFSLGASPKTLAKRLKHILLLELAGDCLYLLERCLVEMHYGETLLQSLLRRVPDAREMAGWLVWNIDPFAGHLWYLSASTLCYGLLWLWSRGKRRVGRGVYLAGLVLLAAHFAMGEFSSFTGIRVDYRVPRSGLFMGLPLFLLGMGVRQYRQRLSRWALPMVPGGIILSILEWRLFGGYDLYLGSVILAAGLLLLTDRKPSVPKWMEKPAAHLGRISATLFLTHLLFADLYQEFFQIKAAGILGTAEPHIRPLLLLGVSLLFSIFWTGVTTRRKGDR